MGETPQTSSNRGLVVKKIRTDMAMKGTKLNAPGLEVMIITMIKNRDLH